MSSEQFDIVLDKILDSDLKANILYNLDFISTEENKEKFRKFVVDSYYDGNVDDILFYTPLYPSLKDIHKRISYIKYSRVIRHGIKCKMCGSENTTADEQRRGGGDEYIPSRVQCFDCGKKYYV